MLCFFNKDSECEGILFSETLLSLLGQLSGVSFLWARLDPEGQFRSGSVARGTLAVLVSPVLRMVHIVLVSRLGAGTVSGLWTNEFESDLNLQHTTETNS